MTGPRRYFMPLPTPPGRPGAWPLAGAPAAFREVAVLARGRPAEILPVEAALAAYPECADRIAAVAAPLALPPRADGQPAIMGIINATPDSFSDGGRYPAAEAAVAAGLAMVAHGADILDVGGESTRPGAEPVPPAEEIARILPVVQGLRRALAAEDGPPAAGGRAAGGLGAGGRAAGGRAAGGLGAGGLGAGGRPIAISIDTRNAATAEAALAAGATILNDVSALGHDPAMAALAPRFDRVCVMHAQGDPQTMQRDPRYDDVLLDVFDFLAERVAAAEAAGVARGKIIVDPGIGFGKRLAHNLALQGGVSLFHALGTPVLVGASRKRFIATLAEATGTGAEATDRLGGSLAAALWAMGQGAQIVRVHDVAATAQARAVWHALATADPLARLPGAETGGEL
ncbi:MAG: dihydropteroate synthase [Pseudomonadota bacterium]